MTTVKWMPLAGPLAGRSAGHGRAVTFLHGFTQTGNSWLPVAEALVLRGYRAVVLDLPGHGDSSGVSADLRRASDMVAAMMPSGGLVGYSLGGRLALHVALAYPHLVRRLVTIGANPGIVDEEERRQRRLADGQLAARIEEIGVTAFLDEWTALPLFAGWKPSDAERADRERNTAAGLAASLRLDGLGAQEPLWSRLGGLAMPVVALAGSLDHKFVAIGTQLAAAVKDGRFVEVPDSGHAAHLQHPPFVADVVRRSVASITPT